MNCEESPHFEHDYEPNFAGGEVENGEYNDNGYGGDQTYQMGSIDRIPLNQYTTGGELREQITPTTFADLGMKEQLYSSKNIEESNVYKINIEDSKREYQIPTQSSKKNIRQSEKRSEIIQFNSLESKRTT